MDGILLVDKPKGWTSFDVVAKVRGIIKTELRKTNPAIKNVKVGHTGTLDPSATGLLVLCVGKYTKKVPDMIRHDKTYEVEMTLGASSTTGDQEGEITKGELPDISKDMLEMVLRSLLGEQMQIPPAFSAIKVNGQRAYDLARQGKEVKLEPRKCTIYSIELKSYDGSKAVFTTSVSSGTYIRSLVEDIGSKLGTHAYMSELRRTHVDRFSVQSALSSDELTIENIKERLLMDKYKPTSISIYSTSVPSVKL
jgi:tRNA pseudouridine55 synthase